jgi:hypothetical protein
MDTRWLATALLALAACGEPGVSASDPPEPDLLFELEGQHARALRTGWDGWDADPPTLREWVWSDRTRDEPKGWRPRDHTIPWDPATATLVATDGTRIALGPAVWGKTRGLVPVDGPVPPGGYDLVVRAEDLEVRHSGLQVHAFGQEPDLDIGSLGDRVFPLELGRDSLDGILGSFTPQLYLRVAPVDDGVADVTVWAEGEQVPLCRAWRGEAELAPQGLVTAAIDEITTEGVGAITFTDVALRFGLREDSPELAGLELTATVDARQLDYIIAPDGSPPEPGATCTLLGRVGMPCTACPETGELSCIDFGTWRGTAQGTTPAAVLQMARATALADIDQAAPCGGPVQGSVICSTIGTAGVGAWMLGLGVVLFRRRRLPGAPDST